MDDNILDFSVVPLQTVVLNPGSVIQVRLFTIDGKDQLLCNLGIPVITYTKDGMESTSEPWLFQFGFLPKRLVEKRYEQSYRMTVSDGGKIEFRVERKTDDEHKTPTIE